MLAIGRALMTNPELLVLDEATEGLAPLLRAYILHCLASRKQHGQAILADADPERIRKAAADLLAKERIDTPSLFGDGHAAERICAELLGQA